MLGELLQTVIAWVGEHPHWFGLLLFLVAFAESLALIGFFMPGALLLFASGALLATGVYPLLDALLYAALGAILGDGLSYWLGRHYQRQLCNLWPLSRHPELLSRGEVFFQRHGGKSVALGRFVGPIRAVVPAVAGMLGMSPLRFYTINILSALLWAPAYILPGVVFGASLSLAAEVAGRLVFLLLLVAATLLLALWMIRWLYRILAPHGEQWLKGLHSWLVRHPRIGPLLIGVIDPQLSAFKGLLIWALLLLLASISFVTLLVMLQQGDVLAFDQHLWQLLQGMRTVEADRWMVAITQLGDSRVSVSLLAVLVLWLWWRGPRAAAVYLFLTLLFAISVPILLKVGLELPRPIAHGDGWSRYGFPSWHAAMAMCLYGFVAVMIARDLPSRWRWLAYGLAAIPVLLISFSRLYLGVHWFSDVLGGLALALAWLALAGIAYRRHVEGVLAWRSMLLVFFMAVALLWPWHVKQSDGGDYVAPQSLPVLSVASWQQGRWGELPLSRSDSLGQVGQSLNIQWVGERQLIQNALHAEGWQFAQQLSWRTPLWWLAPPDGVEPPALLPQQHQGRFESLLMMKRHQGDWWVLRLWRVATLLDREEASIWQGYIASVEFQSSLGLLYLPRTGAVLTSDEVMTLLPLSNYQRHVGSIILMDSGEGVGEKPSIL